MDRAWTRADRPGGLALTLVGLIFYLAASPARQGGGGIFGTNFDPASTLGWAVPLILLGPLLALVMMISGVRGRGAASLAELGVLASGLGVGLALWARWKQTSPYTASYQWINIPVAFTGPQQFQGFGVDESIRLDHLALVYLVAFLFLALLVMAWHRVAGRSEPGRVRFYALCLVLVLGGCGVLVAPDLAELAGFWGITAIATYLLLAQRWGIDRASRGARVALWLPFLADLCLIAGIGVLYSRYGQLTLTQLIPVLHVTPGWGYRSLTVAGVLLAVAVSGRLGLFPLSPWTTASVEAPPAAHALALGAWTLLPLYALFRLEPVIASSGPHAGGRIAGAIAVVGLLGVLASFAGNDIRRVVVLAASGTSALAMLAIVTWPASVASPAVAWAAAAGVPALALGRGAALLAAGTITAAMRTPELPLMGAGARRLARTSAGLLLGCAASALGLAAAAALFASSPGPALGGRVPWLFGAGLFVCGFALARPYFSMAFGALRRRRAFEPDRVRDVDPTAAWSVLLLGVGGLAFVLAVFFLTSWVAFLFSVSHATDVFRTSVLWLAPVAGFAAGGLVYGLAKPRPLAWSGWVGERVDMALLLGSGLFDRFLAAPGLAAVYGVEASALTGGEAQLGLSLVGFGRYVRRLGSGTPVLPVLFILAVLIAVVAGLATPGLAR